MMDMTLANDPKGFSCGEVVNLFYPVKSHHLNPWCGCGEPDCKVWERVRSGGRRNLYGTLSELFPNVSFVVDSSKHPCWIDQQEKIARAMGLETEHVLIWKSPAGLAKSFAKRGNLAEFESAYVEYHRRFNVRGRRWTGVQYESITGNPAVLEALCARLGIPMFEGKQEFWAKRHHTLFGNNSAKISLFSDEHPRFQYIREQRVEFEGDNPASVIHHRKIFQEGRQDVPELARTNDIHWERVEQIAAALRERSIGGADIGAATRTLTELVTAGFFDQHIRCALFSTRRRLARRRLRHAR